MAITEKLLEIKLVADLLTIVSIYHFKEIADSVVDHYGDLESMSSFDLVEMTDDLIGKMNDLD